MENNNEPYKKEVYSPFDIARICRADDKAVESWFAEGKIPFFQIPGGHWRVTHVDLEKFLDASRLPKPKEWEGEMGKFRVLIVEDDHDLLEIIADFLKDELRLDIKKEGNGFSAGLTIASWRPDLILLDFVMPGMNGFEVCRRLRDNPGTRDIPVLAVTSLKNFENRKAVVESGISDFIGKPFYSEELLKKVRTLLGLDAVNSIRHTV